MVINYFGSIPFIFNILQMCTFLSILSHALLVYFNEVGHQDSKINYIKIREVFLIHIIY
jgi:hypothetical protein